ncbi:pectinesterase family protein [Bradyrhizobium sp. HKCCYLS1011]|uniref:pectinesterase family protein n=1 Tax=Bradyrhizobium sp. HKCCYLS1011 TaxID=3420733 RepID=UPI003EBBF950
MRSAVSLRASLLAPFQLPFIAELGRGWMLVAASTLLLLLLLLADGAALAADLSPLPGARHVCADTQLSITFANPPTVGNTGTIRVLTEDGTLVDSIDLANPADAQRPIGGAVSDSGVVHQFNYFPVLVSGNDAIITLHRQLAYDTKYTVTVDPSVLSAAEGFGGVSPGAWRFTTRHARRQQRDRITVAADGRGDVCTVQGAIDLVPANNARPVTIAVKPGTYNEIDYVSADKPFITVRGEDRDATVIQYPNNDHFNVAPVSNSSNQCPQRRIPGTPDLYNCWRALFGVEASDFTLENITLDNTTPYGGTQAEAFRGNNARILLNRVTLSSFQDTLRLQTSGFVTNSLIAGDVDFTWGTGAAFFQNNELRLLHTGYLSQVRNDNTVHGFVYVGNRFTRAAGVPDGTTYLSRIEPLRFPYSEAVFIDNAMDGMIIPAGFQLNPSTVSCANALLVHFWEFGSTDLGGNPVDTSRRLPCSLQILPGIAAQYRDPAFVLGGWVPYTVNATPAGVAPGPTVGAVPLGSAVTVNWSAPAGHSARDLIGLFTADDDDDGLVMLREAERRLVSRQTVGEGTTGKVAFTLPDFGGPFIFRYLRDGRVPAASSNVIGPSAMRDRRHAEQRPAGEPGDWR